MTQHTQLSSEFIIFVTHVEADDAYLKIWGQLDKYTSTCVERFIYPLVEQFSQGYGCPSKCNRLIIGALCCARFQTDGYYRAKILSVHPDGMIVVQFIDYGNVEVLPPNEIHLLESIPGSESLQAYPAMAAEFTLINVLPINGVWENRTIDAIRKTLCYNEYRACIHPMMNNRCLIKLWYNNEDFSELLVREQMALPATLQDMFRPKHLLQTQMPVYQQQSKGNLNNFPPMMQTTSMNQNTAMQGIFPKTSGVIQNKHAVPQSPPVQEALVFKSRVLDVGSRHEVMVSFVEDGPQKFSVQVQSTIDVLNHLMNEINNRPKKPLQEPPLPGAVCLGRYSQDKVLCRAVVMSVMEHKCKLFYVDFGHTEVLPYTDIFQLPPEFINPKVLSIRFTLSGLKELYITQEMKDYFKELVSRKLLLLHVRPPEGPPLIQYGDLYDNGINIKDILKKAFPAPAAMPMTYSYPQLRRLSKDAQEVVQVSFVQSCKKFFVQLDNGIKSLESIMFGLAQYAKTAPAFNMAHLKTGLPCAALYDSQWYRAQVLSITEDKIKVVYVDYGNEEVLPVTSLRTIHDDLVKKLPAQAIKCALNGYEVLSLDQEVSHHFERLTLEKRFHMKVVASQTDGLLIDLFEFETMRSIHPQLLNNPFCDKIENSTVIPQNGEIQHSAKTNSKDFHRSAMKLQANLVHPQRLKLKDMNTTCEDRDKYNKKSNIDSWNRTQTAKPFQENKSNVWRDEWSQEKEHDNRRDRTAPHFHRDGSQNEKLAKEEATNTRSGRDRSYYKHDKSEIDTPNKSGGGGAYRSGKNRFHGNEPRYNRNNSSDKACSDKDSDTSSKGSGSKRGKGGFNRGGRGGRRDGGVSNRLQSTKWNDRNNDRSGYKSGKLNGDYNMGSNKLKDKENNTNNTSYDQVNSEVSWDTNDANNRPQNKVVVNGGLQLPFINITLGAVRNGEVVFIKSPSDFFVQLSPDNLELETVMISIAETYANDGQTMQPSDIQCGTCCISQYEEDLKWYRAVIKSIEGNKATVEFIDYGNTESVDFTKIKVIQKKFLKLPMQAIHCKLFGLTSTENKEIESFTEKIEGKLVEIEFVAEENRIYEVMLREVIDGVSKINYINEEFCKGADLTKAKEIAANKKVSNTITKRVPIASDYAPFDSKWQITSYESESKHDVIVTWFINPNKFYCQILSKEAEFKAMMNEIQKTYAGRESVSHTLQIGSAVIAMFSEDGALYRAEIMSNKMQKGYVVQYVDFGNRARVNQHNIYPVEKKFMQLPKLSVLCSLKNIASSDLDWSGVNNDALDNCFNADKYECIFHNFNCDQYMISLIHNGQDVGDMLVQKNLAVFAVKTLNETDNAMETPDVVTEALNDVERVDINLLSGQTLRMRVSSVESTIRFHIQLPSASKCENVVNKYMADKNTEVMPRLLSREMCLGAGCLINANGTWGRAVVINCSRSVGFDVKLIDTGAYDEILDSALALPGALAAMQNQALECSLQNVAASSDADKQLKELTEGKQILVYVEEVNNSRLLVKLYDLLGNGIMNTEENNGKISTICPMPILSSTHKVSVSCIDHSASIWLQRYSDYEIDTKLLEDLGQYYSNCGKRLEPEVHLFCAAKSIDGRWYRGKIVNHTETTAYVNYIDYGNTEEVALESIMVLEPQFYEPHQLAVNVSLSVAIAGTPTEQINILQTHLLNKELTAVFYNVHKKWIVDLIEDGEKLSDKFRLYNLVEEEQVAPKPSSETQEASTTCKFDVCVSHIDSPSQFWLQRANEITFLTNNQEKLQLEVSDFPAIDGILEEGTLCVAIYSIDNLWYRAEVLDADEDITTVRFIDYGNTDIIDNKTGHIRQMPEAWKNIERCAHKCRLDVIPIDTEDWNESICERFDDLVTSVDTLQSLIIADTTPKRVELFINDKSVSETLVEEKRAIIINAEQAEPVDEIIDLELDPHSAFVCHINSPGEFWVQEEKSVADLEVMADRFMVADMFPKIDDIEEGLLCVAKYPEDEQWYRARVLSHNDNGTQVIYIDYGNSSVSTEIRALPEDLADTPLLSRKCRLELPSHIKEWSEQACEEFIKLAADGATIFLLDVLKEQEISLVKLTLNDQNVTDVLANLCEQYLPVIEERLPPLGEENSPNVMVSHINSPSEFWIQTESSINELEMMSDRLRDAESFLTLVTFDVGTVCAARYPEDGCWYRAMIIARREEGTEVLYMDYGNSAITEELRVLPEDIVNIPTLSKRCALEKQCRITVWSEKACDKFKELAAEGATMFQFETCEEDDLMHVRLSLNGTNIVELLLAECENIPEIGEATNTEIEGTTSNTEVQEEIVNNKIINNSENITDSIKAEQELALNQMESNDDLGCINITNKSEIDEDVINRSFGESDVNERHEYDEEQQNRVMSDREIKNMEFNENSEVVASECTIKTNEVSKDLSLTDITEPDKDLDYATTTCLEESPTVITELSVDDIIGSMVRDTIEDLESREIDVANLLDTNEIQPQSIAQDDANEQKLLSQVESININESSNAAAADEGVLDNAIEDVIEEPDPREIVSVTDEAHPQNVTQLDTSEVKEREVCSKEELGINESLEPLEISETIADVTPRLSDEQTNLSKRIQRQNSTENETVPESTNKDNDSEVVSESTNKDNDSEVMPKSTNKDNDSEIMSESTNKDNDSEVMSESTNKDNDSEVMPESTNKDNDSEVVSENTNKANNSEVMSESTNKNNDSEVMSENMNTNDVNTSSESTSIVIAAGSSSITKTYPTEEHRSLSSRSRSEDKIVPGCVSRGESPHPLTPKTPHSEKLVAGAVNPLQSMIDCPEEDDEILTVSVENIPENLV